MHATADSFSDSIKSAAKAVASNLLSYYHGEEFGKTPGILDGPPPNGQYYWWEGGALWGTMVDYWRLTGDTTWNDVTQYAIVFQGVNSFQDDNWTLSLGNDDQGFWGMSAMLAAENNFPNPSAELLEANPESAQWLALAQGVFNTQAAPDRHDDICGGGLRWQVPPTNVGYDYKNAISNGIFFNLGARLARYTDNATYSDWAVKTWDWMEAVGLIDEEYNVYDGVHVEDCNTITKAQFSYCAAVMLEGAAFMYNYVRHKTYNLASHFSHSRYTTDMDTRPTVQNYGVGVSRVSSTEPSSTSSRTASPSSPPANSPTKTNATPTSSLSRATSTDGWPPPRKSPTSSTSPSSKPSKPAPPPPRTRARTWRT